VINEISKKYDIEMNKNKFDSLYGDGIINGEKVILLKPQTYMNLSGNAIIQAVNYYKIPIENIIIVYDDIDIEPGNIRIRKKGSSGSHNGMKSVVKMLDTEDFTRIRVGIGKPDFENDLINHVIGAIPEEEVQLLNKGIEKASEAIIELLKTDVDIVMNKYNAN